MIGIYGGTFDPVHFGHLRTALEVREALHLDEVRFIPCRQPPHRAQPVASPELRVEMLRQAVADEAGFVVDTREIDRPGPSYMIDTLASLRAELGAATALCLILGHDAFLGLPGWQRWRELTNFAHLLVMTRPGVQAEWPAALAAHLHDCIAADGDRLRDTPCGSVRFQPVTALDISATRIRELLRAGRSARYLLPDAVLETALASGLYPSRS
ncbi:MAG TPA: nicotinate-nucleotide adenylyltransferase [Methylococcaceae bacterium]|nr:nicotinate-nucleotide adenylyltransferase [Methylococcaceae bacterium]